MNVRGYRASFYVYTLELYENVISVININFDVNFQIYLNQVENDCMRKAEKLFNYCPT